MDKEEIIKLWKQGYSKSYIYDLGFHALKSSGRYKNLSIKDLKHEAKVQIDKILIKEYISTKGRFI